MSPNTNHIFKASPGGLDGSNIAQKSHFGVLFESKAKLLDLESFKKSSNYWCNSNKQRHRVDIPSKRKGIGMDMPQMPIMDGKPQVMGRYIWHTWHVAL